MQLKADRCWLATWFIGALALLGQVAAAQEQVSRTVHNLSSSGPGRVRAASEGRVCVFCHASHNTLGMVPLWNRELSNATYQIYRSSTLDATVRQPTGSSKLCLSCHDGTIAMGNIVSQSARIRMSSGGYMPAGLTNLGTDLSDDHPISFTYSGGLSAADRQLVSPGSLGMEVRLDSDRQVQCTTCHDAHNNTYGNFLVMDNSFGALCVTCHKMDGWSSSSHRTSNASMIDRRLGDWPHRSVAENSCRSCHRPHSAGGNERLLIFENEEDNCLSCHNGRVARTNIQSELLKRSAHDPTRRTGRHDPTESHGGDRDHVECSDCHNPHAVSKLSRGSRYIPIDATLAKVKGVGSGGSPTEEAQHEYEVCFRCHGDRAAKIDRRIERQSNTDNLRLKFSPSNPSAHAVISSSRNSGSESVSLLSSVPTGTMLRCTDCHNNDSGPRAGGGGPSGPHGSVHDNLLERNYTTKDNTPESAVTYAMCYKCHNRTSILNDESYRGHKLHIEDAQTPCSACHDPHGVSRTGGGRGNSDHTHLINFDMAIVFPEESTGRLEFKDTGRFSGNCTLTCHNVPHVKEQYGPTVRPKARKRKP